MQIAGVAVAIVALGLAGFAFIATRRTQNRLTAILGTTDSGTLEKTLAGYNNEVKAVRSQLVRLNKSYDTLTDIASLSSQKISVVRFNPFGDVGGDQSFCLAVLDAHDSGYVLTSIHGRSGTRVYVKPLDYGKSKYQLSAEEQQAFSQAAKRLPKELALQGEGRGKKE